jgi:phosphate transport system substrate-binding protein
MIPSRGSLVATGPGGLLAIALATLLASWSGPCAAEEITIAGTGSALETMKLLARGYLAANPGDTIKTVPSLGSRGGISAVLDGAVSVAVSSRPIDEEMGRRGAVTIEYARTPFVFAVSTLSPVTATTLQELAGIYAGTVTRWPDGSEIRVVLRPESDIDSEFISHISPALQRGVAAARLRPGVNVAMTDQDAAGSLERIPGALGTTTLAVIVSERRRLRPLKLEAKEPTVANAASGAYPYFKSLYFVKGRQQSAGVERFIAFVQSATGRKIIEANGQWVP